MAALYLCALESRSPRNGALSCVRVVAVQCAKAWGCSTKRPYALCQYLETSPIRILPIGDNSQSIRKRRRNTSQNNALFPIVNDTAVLALPPVSFRNRRCQLSSGSRRTQEYCICHKQFTVLRIPGLCRGGRSSLIFPRFDLSCNRILSAGFRTSYTDRAASAPHWRELQTHPEHFATGSLRHDPPPLTALPRSRRKELGTTGSYVCRGAATAPLVLP